MKHRFTMSIMVAVALCLLSSCAGRPRVGRVTPCPDEPEWIARGSGEFEDHEGKGLFAVGFSAHQKLLAARRKEALADAERKLARQLKLYGERLAGALSRSHVEYFGGDKERATEFFRQASEAAAQAALERARAIAWWHCPISEELFVLLKLPEQSYVDLFAERVRTLALHRRAELFKDRTEEALDRLDEELRKFRAREAGRES